MPLQDAVLALSPLAYWPCDDATGTTAADIAGSGRTMTGLSDATWGTSRLRPGSSPGSVLTAGAVGQVPSAAWNQLTGPFSIAYVTQWATIASDAAVFKGTTDGYGLARNDISTNDQIRLRVYVGGAVASVIFDANALLRDNPHATLVVGTHDGTRGRIYVDGNLVAGPSTLAAPAAGGDPLQFDMSQATSDVAIWGRALTATEVADLWTAANTAPQAGPQPGWGNNPNAAELDVVLTPPSAAPVTLSPVSASVVWDAGDTWRTSGTVTVPFELDVWQLVKDYSLATVQLSVGLVQPDGSTQPQWISGPMVVRRAAVSRPEDTITIELASQASLVDDLRFTVDTPYPGGVAATQIQGLIIAALPGATFNVTGGGPGLAGEGNAGTSRWQAIETIADYAALEVWQDTDARFVIRAQPVQEATPVDNLLVGAGGNITVSSSDFNRDTFANAFAVRATWIDANGQTDYGYGIAYNTDPATGTQWGGPAGSRVEVEITSQKLTDAECQQIAVRRLRRSLGHGRGVRVTCPIRPWLLPGDPIAVDLPTGGTQVHTVQRVQHDFPAFTTTIDTRLLPA
jgi:Concanavalin A-like lectin/glucanases superfamily